MRPTGAGVRTGTDVSDMPMPARAFDDAAGWPLLERDAEVGALADAVAAARAGRGGVVLVRAAAGLGKTRLLGAASQLARAGDMTVLQASGSVLERDFPFGVALRLFQGRLRAAPEDERARLLEGSAALAGPMLLGGQAVEQALAAGSEASLVHALHWLVVNLSAERPLLLVVDDLHWADAQSIRLLVQLAARVEELGVVVVGAMRPREPGSQTELLAQLTASANVRVVAPGALSEVASAELVRGRAPRTDAFVRACVEETGGNPLLLSELLRALAADGVAGTDADVERVRAIGPEAVAHSVAATLARLGPDCAALAVAVAVLAADTELDVAAALSGLDHAAASRAAAALQDAGLLDDAASLRFRHPLLRRAVYERPAPAARAALHREAARLLLTRAAPHDVASHLVLTHGAGEAWAVDVLRAAAREASALAGHAAAARLLRRALAEPPDDADRPAVLAEAALAAAHAADDDAVPALRAAIDAAADDGARARLWLALSRTQFQHGEMREAIAAAEQGLAAVAGADAGADASLALELEAARNAASLWGPAGGAAVAARVAATGLDDAPPRTQGEREVLAWLAGMELLRGEDRERTLTLARRAWDGGAYVREGTGDAAAMGAMNAALLRSGAAEEALAVLDALVEDARRRASPFAYATWRTTRGTSLLHLGRLAEAESDLEEALAARALGWDATAPLAIESYVTVLLEQDRLGDAAAVLATAETLEGSSPAGRCGPRCSRRAGGWRSPPATRRRRATTSSPPVASRARCWGRTTPRSCRGGRTRRWRSGSSGGLMRRARWRRRRCATPAASARRAPSRSRCGCRRSSPAARRASGSRWRRSRRRGTAAPPRASSTPGRSARSAPSSAPPAAARRPRSTCAPPSTSRTATAPTPWPARCATSSSPPAAARAAPAPTAPAPSPPANAASPTSPPRASPTARSQTPSSSPRRPSASTSATSTASSTSTAATTSPPPSTPHAEAPQERQKPSRWRGLQ